MSSRKILLIILALSLVAASLAYLLFTKGIGNLIPFKQKTDTPQPSPQAQQTTVVCKRFTNIDEAVKDNSIACVLDLSQKEATASPQDLSKLAQLTKLNTLILKGYKLTEFPAGIDSLKDLITLDLSDNQIKEVPNSIANLRKLEVVDLSNNQISSISAKIGQAIKPLVIRLRGNPIQSREKIKQTFPQTTIQF